MLYWVWNKLGVSYMAKDYCFQFPGTEEEFLRLLSNSPNKDCNSYYFDDYLVRIENGEYKFGVARGGHSGGYWYIPEASEKDGWLCFCGNIQYISPYSSDNGDKKGKSSVGEILAMILLFPLILIITGCLSIASLIKKWKGKAVTTEDKLTDLMVNHLHCKERFSQAGR